MDCEPALMPAMLFSDSVIREAGTGKLTLVGCFGAFNAVSLPLHCPPFVVTVCVTNLRGPAVPLDLTVRIETRTSHVVASIGARLDPSPEAPPLDPTDVHEIPIVFPGVVFPVAGRYSVVAILNNQEVGRRALLVRAVQSGAHP